MHGRKKILSTNEPIIKAHNTLSPPCASASYKIIFFVTGKIKILLCHALAGFQFPSCRHVPASGASQLIIPAPFRPNRANATCPLGKNVSLNAELLLWVYPVSYTHLTLPTNREV